jgi:hypothetical protein
MKRAMKNYIILTAFCLNILGYIGNALTQDTTPDISQIKFLYDELRFEEAIKFGHYVLKEEDISSPQHLGYIHQYMAYSFFNLGNSDSTRVHFLSLLSVNPDIELNPVDTSPKIIDFFNQTKTNFQQINDNPNIISYPSYVFIEDKRPDAAWRSAILPGWGQYYKGQNTRAYIFGGAFLTSAVILGVSIVNENKYKDKYLNSFEPEEIQNNYDSYNNWSKMRQVSTYTTIGIWLISFADAIWSDYPKMELDVSSGTGTESSLISFVYHF